jgi:HTH-type transcriptional regulator/antitoxin HigA
MKTQIITKEIYEKHLERIFELMQTDTKPNSKESDELEALSILVKDYENEIYPMNKQIVSREEIMKALE